MMCVMMCGAKPEVTHTDAKVQSTYSPSVSFTCSLGVASSKRTIVVATYRSTVTGVTIAGNAATLLYDSGSLIKFWAASVPSGTSGSIVVSSSSGANGPFISVWAVYRIKAMTPTATAQFTNPTTSTTTSVSISAQSKGVVLAAAASSIAGISSASWSGATGDSNQLNSGTLFTTAAADDLAAGTLGLTVTWNVASFGRIAAIALR